MEIDGEQIKAGLTGLRLKECDVMTVSALSVVLFKMFPVAWPRRFASRPEVSVEPKGVAPACSRSSHRRTTDCHQPELAVQNHINIHIAPSRLKN